jgi:acetyl-CoA C-acetyltransferase
MAEAYIVSAVRTAGGKRNGRLQGWHPVNMAAEVLNAIVDRSAIDPESIEDVVMGCVTQAGEQAINLGRNAVLASKLPTGVPAVTVDRQCGSSQQAIHFAVQGVMSGMQDIVIAAGVESMTRTPMGLSRVPNSGLDFMTDRIRERFGVANFSQFAGAEMMAKKYGFVREQLDAFGLESHKRAAAATNSGAFEKEILPLRINLPDGGAEIHVKDEGIRYDASLQSMASVKLLQEGGTLTAATSSQICDGAAALLVVSERALRTHGLTPMARVHHLTIGGGDPVIMLEAPIFATERALKRANMKLDDIDLYEVNEAFAPVPLAWSKVLGADHDKLNVNGGAIALGHPLGASGVKLMTTLVHALRARGKRFGLQTMCEGGGLANVTIVEAL